MKALGLNLDFIVIAPVIAAFLFVASQRLATAPVPEGDEAYMMQVTYEMLYRHKVAVPMMRYLGGNIENAWHSRTPIYFLLMIGFHKLVGFGLLQARFFNLLTAAATLVMVYLAGRRRFDWRVGLVAVLLLTTDVSFLERSRLLRNDFAGAFFALLAYYLYELAQDKKVGASLRRFGTCNWSRRDVPHQHYVYVRGHCLVDSAQNRVACLHDQQAVSLRCQRSCCDGL